MGVTPPWPYSMTFSSWWLSEGYPIPDVHPMLNPDCIDITLYVFVSIFGCLYNSCIGHNIP